MDKTKQLAHITDIRSRLAEHRFDDLPQAKSDLTEVAQVHPRHPSAAKIENHFPAHWQD